MRLTTVFFALFILAMPALAQQGATPKPPSTLRAPSRAEILRGEYGRYRANNDLLHYDLDVRVDPGKKWISGKNTVRFKMLKDDGRIQLDLYYNFTIERITHEKGELKYTRDLNTVLIDFPQTLKAGPNLFHRFPLFRLAARARAVRCAGVQDGSDRRSLDQHRQRGRGLGGVVAQQGFMAR